MKLLLDGSRGIRLPHVFAVLFGDEVQGVDKSVLAGLSESHSVIREDYWELWFEVLDNGYFIKDGVKYLLHQDQDLFLVEEMEAYECGYCVG